MAASILTKNQSAFLASVGKNPHLTDHFYLTGGTALAEYYLRHRYSEDLDFFSEREVDLLAVNTAIDEIRKSIGASAIDFQQSYNRNMFFLRFGGDALKTEFTFYPFPRVKKGPRKNGIIIDSLLDIAVNKLFTIYQRSAARDYVDLYCIIYAEDFSIGDIIQKAKAKFDWHIDPIQLGTQFLKARDAKDFPRMIKDIPAKKWQDFFLSEARKLKPDIFS